MRYVQFGSGNEASEGWINYDNSPTILVQKVPLLSGIIKTIFRHKISFPKVIKYGDIVKGLPEKDNSVDVVYCSHVLEHLTLEDCLTSLDNVFKILKPGGTFRLVLPDLEYDVKQYLADLEQKDELANYYFFFRTYLGKKTSNKTLKSFLQDTFSSPHHLWMWDYCSLSARLKYAGFVNIRRASFGDNPDPIFKEIEKEGRWVNNLGIECQKPLSTQ